MTTTAEPVDRLLELVRYDPRWKQAFAELADDLGAVMGAQALRIEHIGSTALEGMAAKPIIDIQVSVRTLGDPRYVEPLWAAGYWLRHHEPEQEHQLWRERPGQPRANIHLVRAGSHHERRHILFRDYLRSHPEVAADYLLVKERLASQAWASVQDYADAKGPFVAAVTTLAELWAETTGWSLAPVEHHRL